MIDELEHVATPIARSAAAHRRDRHRQDALCRRIYELKRARQHLAGEFVAVNCATLRGDVAMSALFGHAQGAFTGAAEARAGLLRKADGGLLFLDEIGELGRDEQAMLLTAIEEKRFYPVGSDKQVTSDFQLIAGTNRDLARGGPRRPVPRRSARAARAVDVPAPGAARAPRGHRAEPRLRARAAVGASSAMRVSFAKPARDAFLRFARGARRGARTSATSTPRSAAWRRSPTAAGSTRPASRAEIARLDAAAPGSASDDGLAALLGPRADALDRFDRVQLADVVSVCAAAPSLSAAGRALFAASLASRTTKNDADRLRKYLARFGLTFEALRA